MDSQGTSPHFYGPIPGPDGDTPTITISLDELDRRIAAAVATQRGVQYRARGPVRPDRKYPTWIAVAALAVAVIILGLVVFWPSSGPGWPPSVATVKTDIATACKNPNVASEPDQVNFACNPSTDQVLWVFSLLTSNNNPSYVNSKTGRVGLEPIAAAEGGQLAQWLNFHEPYNPFNPVESLDVAARAINSIVGGATITGPNGVSTVVPGLESTAANCLRYTGSSALRERTGYPPLCARPVSTLSGQGALVEDIFQKWMPGATPSQGYDAALLFMNSNNPGASQVQAVLKQLAAST